jgi:hypothetical protein
MALKPKEEKKKESLFSKAVSAVKSYASNVAGGAKIVYDTIKDNAKKVSANQGANALQATTLPGAVLNPPNLVTKNINLSGAQIAQNQIDSQKKASFNPITGGGNIANAEAGFGASGGESNNTALTSGQFGGVTAPPVKKSSGGSSKILSKASAPTSVDQINSGIETMNLDGGGSDAIFSSFSSSSLGSGGSIMGSGTASASAANEGLGVQTGQAIQSAKEQAAEQAQLNLAEGKKQEASLLSKIFKEQDKQAEILQDKRVDLEKEYKIQAARAEIGSLEQTLGKMEVEVQNQVMAAQDKLGTNNFINNQIQQIDRNSRPALNRLRSDINFKTGILTQNEALIEKAMEQATQESRDRMNNLKWFYGEFQDTVIAPLGKAYDDALKARIKEEEEEYDYQVKNTEWKRDTIMKYGLEGLTLNDSENVIMRAATKKQAVENVSNVESFSSGFSSSKIESSVREDVVSLLDDVEAGVTTPDKAYSKLRTLYSPKEVSDNALKSLLGISTSTSTPASYKPTQEEVDAGRAFEAAIYNSLF